VTGEKGKTSSVQVTIDEDDNPMGITTVGSLCPEEVLHRSSNVSYVSIPIADACPISVRRSVQRMRITRPAFAELFAAHIPEWLPSAWVQGTRYVFVDGGEAEIDELERILAGVCL
jgi:hypothetical protein